MIRSPLLAAILASASACHVVHAADESPPVAEADAPEIVYYVGMPDLSRTIERLAQSPYGWLSNTRGQRLWFDHGRDVAPLEAPGNDSDRGHRRSLECRSRGCGSR